MKRILTAILFFSSSLLFAQMSDNAVREKLELIHDGKIDQVRAEIPSLQSQYPNDAGVAYLDAAVTEDGSQAAKKYQLIVDNYPKSEWADDALYKVYQYFYAVGLYKTAESKMAQLKVDYPTSIYLNDDSKEPQKLAGETKPVPIESEPAEETTQPAETPKSEAVPSVQPEGKYAVQVAVYSQEPTAVQQSAVFTQTVGRQATVFPKEANGKTLYAVAFEGFQDEQSARSFGADLKTKFNMDWFLVKR